MLCFYICSLFGGTLSVQEIHCTSIIWLCKNFSKLMEFKPSDAHKECDDCDIIEIQSFIESSCGRK